jgi:hypothetical protein
MVTTFLQYEIRVRARVGNDSIKGCRHIEIPRVRKASDNVPRLPVLQTAMSMELRRVLEQAIRAQLDRNKARSGLEAVCGKLSL